MQRKFVFAPEQHYHLYNRGVEKREIFREDSDYKRFQNLLYLCNSTKSLVYKLIQGEPLEYVRGDTLASILGYSLMPNHFHIICRENENSGISTFMNKLSTAYTMYFNTKYERTGPLMCRPFRAKHVVNDDYFRWVFSYVHMNALDIYDRGWKERGAIDVGKASDYLNTYLYSSYRDYFTAERPASKIIDKLSLPLSFTEIESVENMLQEYRSKGSPWTEGGDKGENMKDGVG